MELSGGFDGERPRGQEGLQGGLGLRCAWGSCLGLGLGGEDRERDESNNRDATGELSLFLVLASPPPSLLFAFPPK